MAGDAVPPIAVQPLVRAALPGDIPGLVRLFGRHYAQYKPDTYFAWQFFSPEAPAVLAVAVEPDGEVVGSFGFMRRSLSDGRFAGQIMDILLDVEFRGRGLFEAMAAHTFTAFPEVAVRLVLSNRAGTAAVARTLGLQVVAQVPVFSANTSDPDAAIAAGPAPSAGRLHIRYDEIGERWRFAEHPFNRYHRLEAAGLHGYLKLFMDSADSSRHFGDIMYVSPGTPAATVAWLRSARAWFHKQGVGRCGLWSLPGAPMAAAALWAGFQPRVQEHWLCAQAVEKNFRSALDEDAWDVCSADAEFY